MRAISLFSNCGAGDFGYSKAGFEFEVMAELEPRRLRVALANHPGALGIAGDLRLTWPTVVERFKATENAAPLNLLSACPPCQGLSSARGRRGVYNDADTGSADARNLLVLPIAQIALALQPRAIVVENVVAFLRRQVR